MMEFKEGISVICRNEQGLEFVFMTLWKGS